MWEILVVKYRFYTYSVLVIMTLLIFFVILGLNNRARVKDIALIKELKEFSYGLEKYYSNYRRYPEAQQLNLSDNLIISDNGLAEPHGSVYYRGDVDSGAASYSSDSLAYEIHFKLRRHWPVVGVTDSKDCLVSNNFNISCEAENK